MRDLLLFARAACGFQKTKLEGALARKRGPIALAWQKNGDDVYRHNGGTGGFRSFLTCSVKSGAAAVVLSDVSIDVDDVGRYELAPNVILTVTREGTLLQVQATGQPKTDAP